MVTSNARALHQSYLELAEEWGVDVGTRETGCLPYAFDTLAGLLHPHVFLRSFEILYRSGLSRRFDTATSPLYDRVAVPPALLGPLFHQYLWCFARRHFSTQHIALPVFVPRVCPLLCPFGPQLRAWRSYQSPGLFATATLHNPPAVFPLPLLLELARLPAFFTPPATAHNCRCSSPP